ncbi:MAG: DUF2059 domain-containing protein [Acidobacteria bacterium]|nr:DUF2059 domain-containing protein [Acidobacteriota bacterium]
MRRTLTALLLPAALLAQAPTSVQAAPEADHAQVKKLLVAMKYPDQVKVGFLKGLEAQKAKADSMPPGFLEAFKAAFNADDFVEAIVPVYAKHFTNAEVQAALKFYDSPEGASFAAKQATLSSELEEAGKRYGMELALKVMQDQMKKDAPQSDPAK